jgi:hypothetical protein
MLDRMQMHYRIDQLMTKGDNSFLAKYGNIKVEKINENVEI